jgi:Zn-dependent alcohol dehydrogenase
MTKCAGQLARIYIAKAADREVPRMFLSEIANAFELMKRGEPIRGVVTF